MQKENGDIKKLSVSIMEEKSIQTRDMDHRQFVNIINYLKGANPGRL